MERKLVEQGKKTLMVSIPIKWAKEQGLSKGALVSLEIGKERIILTPKKEKRQKTIEIKLHSLTESSIRTLLTNAYRCGYERIIAHWGKDRQFDILKDVLKTKIMGLDITKKEGKQCV